MTSAFLTLVLPVGAIVLRRQWRSSSAGVRMFVFLVTAGAALFAWPALLLITGAVIQTGGEIGDAAAGLDLRVIAAAAAAGVLLAAVTLRRTRVMTLTLRGPGAGDW